MILNRQGFAVAAAIVLSGLSIFVMSAAGPSQVPSSSLDFLEVGKPYLIRFPEKSNLFSATTSGVSETTFTTEDGEKVSGSPAIWSATLTITAFRVVLLSKGSWALLEHPESVEDAAQWAQQLRGDSGKSKPHPGNTDPPVASTSTKLRTARTWVNLDHAVAISPLSADVEGPSQKNAPAQR